MAAARTVGVINGTMLLIYSGNNPIALSTTCGLVLNTDMRDTSNKDTSGWKTVLPGMKNWTITCEGLIAYDTSYNYVYLMGLQIAKTSLSVSFKSTNTSGDYYWSGTAYITSINATGQNEGNATFSVTLQGSGALTVTDPLAI